MIRKILAWIIENIVTHIRIPYTRKVSFEELQFFKANALRGGVILTFTPYQLSNLGIKGKYTHCEMIVNNDYCVGAQTDGVDLHVISKLLSKASRYAVILPKELDIQQRGPAVVLAVELSEKGIDYDFVFLPDNKKFYCSEFVLHCLREGSNYDIDYGKLIHPQEFVDDKDRWVTVQEYDV